MITGTLINALTVVFASLLGLAIGSRLSESIRGLL